MDRLAYSLDMHAPGSHSSAMSQPSGTFHTAAGMQTANYQPIMELPQHSSLPTGFMLPGLPGQDDLKTSVGQSVQHGYPMPQTPESELAKGLPQIPFYPPFTPTHSMAERHPHKTSQQGADSSQFGYLLEHLHKQTLFNVPELLPGDENMKIGLQGLTQNIQEQTSCEPHASVLPHKQVFNATVSGKEVEPPSIIQHSPGPVPSDDGQASRVPCDEVGSGSKPRDLVETPDSHPGSTSNSPSPTHATFQIHHSPESSHVIEEAESSVKVNCSTEDIPDSVLPRVHDTEIVITSDNAGVHVTSPASADKEILSLNRVKSIKICKQPGSLTTVKIEFSAQGPTSCSDILNPETSNKTRIRSVLRAVNQERKRSSESSHTTEEGTPRKLSSPAVSALFSNDESMERESDTEECKSEAVMDGEHDTSEDQSFREEEDVEGNDSEHDEDAEADGSTTGDPPLLDVPLSLPHLGSMQSPASVGSTIDINIHIDDNQCILENGQKRWKCKECEKSYTTKHNLINHMMGHKGLKPHCCLICGKFFKQVSHLSTHMLTHSNMRPHTCKICQRSFTQTSHMKRHMTIHMERRPHVCDVCNRGFAFPSELKAHAEKHCKTADNTCAECGQGFDSPKKLKQHQAMVHRGDSELTCTTCGKVFTYPSQLRDHMVKHSGERPYMCTECGMDFMKDHHLRAHLFTHTGLKPWICPVCSRAFNQKANMQRHMLIHGTEKLFRCEVCSREFSQPQTLKAHMVTHADKKPFQCQICGKEFGRLHNLQGHMHIHKDTKPHVCFCGASFTLKGNLTRHRKVKHGLNDSDECTDEEAAKILNSMSGRNLVEESLSDIIGDSAVMGDSGVLGDSIMGDSGGAYTDEEWEMSTPQKKSRKSIPRKTVAMSKEDSEDECEEAWTEHEDSSQNGATFSEEEFKSDSTDTHMDGDAGDMDKENGGQEATEGADTGIRHRRGRSAHKDRISKPIGTAPVKRLLVH